MFSCWEARLKISYYLSWLGITLATLVIPTPSLALPLSPGDRLNVSIPNEQYFARTYEVNQNGELEVPLLGNVTVQGLEPIEVEEKLSWLLVEKGYFPKDKLQLTVEVLNWAVIQVSIAGELFLPGRVSINETEDLGITAVSPTTLQVTGKYAFKRYLTNAIQAAGGVLPTANIKEIHLIRQGKEQIIDLSGVFTGEAIEDIPLIAGDRIIIPATNFQAELARPSQITRPAVEVFASNLSIPADSNAESTVDKGSITFTYGSRLSHAVIAANCVGGTHATNAHRHALLVRANRLTGETTYIDLPVEDIMRDSHNEIQNPLLMPLDGIACYDSRVTNARDIFQTIGDIFNPIKLLRDLF